MKTSFLSRSAHNSWSMQLCFQETEARANFPSSMSIQLLLGHQASMAKKKQSKACRHKHKFWKFCPDVPDFHISCAFPSFLAPLTSTLVSYFYSSHFRDKEIRTQIKEFTQGDNTGQWQSSDLNPRRLTPGFTQS